VSTTDAVRDQLLQAKLEDREVAIIGEDEGLTGQVISVDVDLATVLPRADDFVQRVQLRHVRRIRILDLAPAKDRDRARVFRNRGIAR
jgi:hypothetical protein